MTESTIEFVHLASVKNKRTMATSQDSTTTTTTQRPKLYVLDYGAGNVRSLANSIERLGYEFEWIKSVEDFDKAEVSASSSASCCE